MTEDEPCDLLADPAPWQVREMWGTGWDMRLVLGYVDLECWSWSSRLDPALRALQETRVATREESGVLGFPSRRGLTPRGSLQCKPEIPAFPGEEN